MSDASDRNALLDQLVAATQAWATKRRKELTDRVASSKKILQGRTGAERLAQSSVQATSALVVTEINSFLAP